MLRRLLLVLASLAAGLGAQLSLAAAGPIIDGKGTATLTWSAPTQGVGNVPLTSPVTGYVIFWGEQSRFGRCANAPTTNPGPVMISNPADKPSSKVDVACYPNHLDVSSGSTASQALILSLNKSTTVNFAIIAYLNTGSVVNDLSAFSNEVNKVFTLSVSAPPLPPVLQSVSVELSCTTDDATVTCTFTAQ